MLHIFRLPKMSTVFKHAQKRKLLKFHQTQGLALSVGFLHGNGSGRGEDVTYIKDAITFFSNVLEEHEQGILVAGTGQYMLKGNSRLIVLNFERNFLKEHSVYLYPKQLIDIGFTPEHRNKLNECISLSTELKMHSGVLDFVNNGRWNYGFTLTPFSIFSRNERLCLLHDDTLFTSMRGIQHLFDVLDIEHIGVWVSSFPHTHRRLVLGLKDWRFGETTTIPLIDVTSTETSGDLFRLAVDTEWMLKAAALLCAKIKRHGNKELYLKVSAPLQPKNNVWVAIQQKKWMKMVRKNAKEGDWF